MEVRFKKENRVKVISSYYTHYNITIDSVGTVMEDDSEDPWIWFDDPKCNYTKKGTSISQYDLKSI